MHVAVNTPAGLMELFAHTLPSAAAFPMERAGRLLRYVLPSRGDRFML
jgi:hypothetical protein